MPNLFGASFFNKVIILHLLWWVSVPAMAADNTMGEFLRDNILTIYQIIDIVTTLAVAFTILFVIISLSNPREKKIAGTFFALVLFAALLPNNDFLLNTIYETIFGQPSTNILRPKALKTRNFNSTAEVNAVMVTIILLIQLVGKIFLIWQTYSLANIMRGVKKGGAISHVVGIICAVILYNMTEFLTLLHQVGGPLATIIDALFNVPLDPAANDPDATPGMTGLGGR